MKKYIKNIFEDFNADDFLEDFGVERMTFKKIQDVAEKFDFTDEPIIKVIKRATPIEFDYGIDGNFVDMKSESTYNFSRYLDAPYFSTLAKLTKEGYPSTIHIDWKISFKCDISDSPNKKYEVQSYFNIKAKYLAEVYGKRFETGFTTHIRKRKGVSMYEAIHDQLYEIMETIKKPGYDFHDAIYGRELVTQLNTWVNSGGQSYK